jgi:excisionase family DNA binding protein
MTRDASSETQLPELLTVAQVAAYLGVPVSTIHFWRGRKEAPPGIKVGKRLYFRATDVAQWLEDRQAAA